MPQEIIAKALEILNPLLIKPPIHRLEGIAFTATNEIEANATAAALVYAFYADQLDTDISTSDRSDLDKLLTQHGYAYDDKEKRCTIKTMPKSSEFTPGSDFRQWIANIQAFAKTFAITPDNEETILRGKIPLHTSAERIEHLLMQGRLLAFMTEHHGIEDGPDFDMKPSPRVPAPTIEALAAYKTVRDLLINTPMHNDPIKVELDMDIAVARKVERSLQFAITLVSTLYSDEGYEPVDNASGNGVLVKTIPAYTPNLETLPNGKHQITLSMDSMPGWKEAETPENRQKILRTVFKSVLSSGQPAHAPQQPKTPKPKKPKRIDPTLLDPEREKRQELQRIATELEAAANRMEAARQPEHPSLDASKTGLNNLRNTPPQDPVKKLAAEMITHAAEQLAQVLDIRSNDTLATAKYEPDELAPIAAKTALHRQLADMLLSNENLYRAARASGMARTFDSQREPLSGALEQSNLRKKIAANLQFLSGNEAAQEFLQEQSKSMPGLLLLLQASLLETGPASAESNSYVRTIKKEDAPLADIVDVMPELLSRELGTFLSKKQAAPALAQ